MDLPAKAPEPSPETKQLALETAAREREARETEAEEWRGVTITNALRYAACEAGGTAEEQLKRYKAALDFFIDARKEGRADATGDALKVARSQPIP
jgi:hypothetical protein